MNRVIEFVEGEEIDWVVLKQQEAGEWADCWMTTYVNTTAVSAKEAIRQVGLDERKGGEGRYIAIPNMFWVAQNVKVKRIAEVEMEEQEMV